MQQFGGTFPLNPKADDWRLSYPSTPHPACAILEVRSWVVRG